eukprot:1039203-Pleurochrysis_carterae.AAC.1
MFDHIFDVEEAWPVYRKLVTVPPIGLARSRAASQLRKLLDDCAVKGAGGHDAALGHYRSVRRRRSDCCGHWEHSATSRSRNGRIARTGIEADAGGGLGRRRAPGSWWRACMARTLIRRAHASA